MHVAVALAGATQAAHEAPPAPQAFVALPAWQSPDAEQHPEVQDWASHTHAFYTHLLPLGHVPVPHIPPQPSDAPHVLPAQVGVHAVVPQTLVPPPPQVCPVGHVPHASGVPQRPSRVPHFPAQSAASLGTQAATHAPASHVEPVPHARHAWPPVPQLGATRPSSQMG